LFTASDDLPEGFCYRPNILACDGADALSRELVDLPFKPFDFRGCRANRQVVSFGYRYDYDRQPVLEASPPPSFLVSLRDKIAAIFDRRAEAFRQVLMNQFRPGAGIVGIAIRRSLTVEPRSVICFRGRRAPLGAEHSATPPASLFNCVPDP
jgi:hypothetical protein